MNWISFHIQLFDRIFFFVFLCFFLDLAQCQCNRKKCQQEQNKKKIKTQRWHFNLQQFMLFFYYKCKYLIAKWILHSALLAGIIINFQIFLYYFHFHSVLNMEFNLNCIWLYALLEMTWKCLIDCKKNKNNLDTMN